MKHVIRLALAIALALAALWGGTYFFSVVDEWAKFPTFMTSVLAAVAGVVWTCVELALLPRHQS